MHGPLSARPQLHGGILSFRLGLMCAADQEADLLVRETNAWQQTHGSTRAALTAASDITSPLENCAVPSDYRAAADRRFRLSTSAL